MRRPFIVVTALMLRTVEALACAPVLEARAYLPSDGEGPVSRFAVIYALAPNDAEPVLTLVDEEDDAVETSLEVLPSGRITADADKILVVTPRQALAEGVWRVSQIDGPSWSFSVGPVPQEAVLDAPVVEDTELTYTPFLEGCPEVPPRLTYSVRVREVPGAAIYTLKEYENVVATFTSSTLRFESEFGGDEPRHCFRVVALTREGRSSPPSDEVCLGGEPSRAPLDAGTADAGTEARESPGCSSSPGPSPLFLVLFSAAWRRSSRWISRRDAAAA